MRVAIVRSKLKKALRGQGVVEYAGSLVIAVTVVLAGLLIAPPSLSDLMSTIFSSASSMLIAALNG